MNRLLEETDMIVRFRVAIISGCPTYFAGNGKYDADLHRTVEAAVVHPDPDAFKPEFLLGAKYDGSRQNWANAFGDKHINLVAFLGTRDEMMHFYTEINIKAVGGSRFNALSTVCAHTAIVMDETSAYSAINSVESHWRATAVLIRSESFNRSHAKVHIELPFVKEFTTLIVWDADEVMKDVLSRSRY